MESKKSIRMVLTGGGTGGHLFPAVATAQKLSALYPGSEILFVGTVRKIDRASLSRYGFSIRTVHCYGLKGKNLYETIKAFIFLPIAFVEALWFLLCFRPQIVVGVGGYVTAPVLVAAKCMGLPTLIHEQNSIPGLANRKLGSLVDRICYSIPGSEKYFRKDKTLFTGNPVREQIAQLAANRKVQQNDGLKTLLVLGGSQGAHAVNAIVVKTLVDRGGSLPVNIRVIHQTGVDDERWVAEEYKKAGIRADVAAFFNDMARVYKEADLLISRAGATTLAELAVLGKPAILIPYPSAADDHQMKNGEYYRHGGGVLLCRQDELTEKKLASMISEIFLEPGRLKSMGKAMADMGRSDAADRIVHCCLELIRQRG